MHSFDKLDHRRATAYDPFARSEACLLYAIHGNAPVVISVPHDGAQKIPGAPTREETRLWERRGGPDPRDEATLPIGEAVLMAMQTQGQKASLLASKLHRSHADMNRGPGQEPFADGFEAIWHEYHARLQGIIAQAVADHGRCLLIDLHGFLKPPGSEPYDIVLGTNEHATSPHGCDRTFARVCGEADYHTVFSPDPERGATDRYRGGWIVRGTAERWRGHRVDAIQVELAAHIRLGTTHDHLADTLAKAACLAVRRT